MENKKVYITRGKMFEHARHAKAWASRYITKNQTPTVKEYELVPTGKVYQKSGNLVSDWIERLRGSYEKK